MSSCAAASTGTSSGRRLRTSPGCGTRPTSSSRNPNDKRSQNLTRNLHLQYVQPLRTRMGQTNQPASGVAAATPTEAKNENHE